MAVASSRYPVLPYLFEIHLSEREFCARRPHDAEIVGVECFRYTELKNKIACGEIYVSLPVAVLASFLFRREINHYKILRNHGKNGKDEHQRS